MKTTYQPEVDCAVHSDNLENKRLSDQLSMNYLEVDAESQRDSPNSTSSPLADSDAYLVVHFCIPGGSS